MGKEMGITPEEAHAFLDKYFSAVEDEHSVEAFDSLKRVVGFAKKLRDERIANGKAGVEVSDRGPDEGQLPGVEEREAAGPPEANGQGKPDPGKGKTGRDKLGKTQAGRYRCKRGRLVVRFPIPLTEQYRKYQLPGGENYREKLMTLPPTTTAVL